MDIVIKPGKLCGEIKAVASKSYAHRLLILSALSDNNTILRCSESSEDIEATVNCLSALGAEITAIRGGFAIKPIVRAKIEKSRVLDCSESGSTLRFLLPLACVLGTDSIFTGQGKLPQRPMAPLYDALSEHGCVFTGDGLPVTMRGKIKGGYYTIPADISSQFVSGLLMALPLLHEDSILHLEGNIESKDYIHMTLFAIKLFGADIEFNTNDLYIKGNTKYISPGTLTVEGDWSNAAFWLCAGAVGGTEVKCTGLDIDSSQGDKAIIEILREFGAKIDLCKRGVTVTGSALHGIEINAKDIPDLVPILAVVASAAEGKTVIKNAGRLRLKESDRLVAVSQTLSSLGAEIFVTPDGLNITGQKQLKGGRIHSFGDHRIAMMAAVASAVCRDAVIIENAESVNKSYPGFYSNFNTLGGNAKILK